MSCPRREPGALSSLRSCSPPPLCTCFLLPLCSLPLHSLLGYLPPPRCSSAVRNGLLLLNLLLCNHHTLGDQIITRELRDTLFRHSGIAPGTEPMPTTRTVLMMLLNRYSEPPGSPEHTGTLWKGWFSSQESGSAALWPGGLRLVVLAPSWKDTMNLQEMSKGLGAPVRS